MSVLRASEQVEGEKAHTNPSLYHNKTGGGKGETKRDIHIEVGKGAATKDRQRELYQELEAEAMDEREYEGLDKKETMQC